MPKENKKGKMKAEINEIENKRDPQSQEEVTWKNQPERQNPSLAKKKGEKHLGSIRKLQRET